MKFKPISARVIVKPDSPEVSWPGGVIKPDSVLKEELKEAEYGTVVAVGIGEHSHQGILIPMEVKVNDRVILDPSMTIQIGDTGLAYCWEKSLISVIVDEEDDEKKQIEESQVVLSEEIRLGIAEFKDECDRSREDEK